MPAPAGLSFAEYLRTVSARNLTSSASAGNTVASGPTCFPCAVQRFPKRSSSFFVRSLRDA